MQYINQTENQTATKVAAIYCRVSTIEQAEEGYSIGEQERLLVEFCEKNGWEVYKTYADKGISGKDIRHRPAVRELLHDATEKKFNVVISWKINRLSRRLADAIRIVETLDNYGITYRSYSEPFESDTPAGRMQFQMMALVGEFERGTIAQNVKMGMCAKARSGEWCGGIAPLGYDWVPMEGTEQSARRKSRLEINEEEAETVRRIFSLYASGKGYKAIVNKINKEGCRTKRGNPFSVAQLRDILTNPVYIGKVRYDVRRNWNEKRRHNINPNPIITEGIHHPIIDMKQWNRVQGIMKQKSGKPSRIYDGEYPLTGILRCPECGAGMVISRTTNTLKDGSKKRIAYYACGAWKNKGTAVCHSNSIQAEKANDFVYHELEKVFTDGKFLKMILDKVNEESRRQTAQAEKEWEKAEKELKQYESRRKKIFEAYEDGLVTAEEFLKRKQEIAGERKKWQEKIEELTERSADRPPEQIPYETVRNILQNFSRVLNSDGIEWGLKKQMLHMLISEMTIRNRKEIDTIHIHLTGELVQFLQNTDGTSIRGVPPDFLYEKMGIRSLHLEFAI